MKFLFTILFLMVMHAGSGQAMADGQMPKQRNPNKQNRNLPRNLNDRPLLKAKAMDKLKRTEEYKSAFMTKKLDLTPDQNQKFLPLFRQYQSEVLDAQLEMRALRANPEINGLDQADKEEAISMKIIGIRKHYRVEFSKVIPSDKVALISKYELEFNDEAQRQLREKRDEVNN